MRIFVAGGTGAIGRPLVAALVAAGHDVTVLSRREERVAALGLPGVVPAVGDAFDPDRVLRAVQAATARSRRQPADQSAPVGQPSRDQARLRRDVPPAPRGLGHVWPPPASAGARRVVAQSISFAYRPGPGVRTESDPLWTDATRPDRYTDRSGRHARVRHAGRPASRASCCATAPSTGRAPISRPMACTPRMCKRRLPIPGDGGGLFGLVHVDDAARGHRGRARRPDRRLQRGRRRACAGLRVDARSWPALLGAKPPRHVPEALAASARAGSWPISCVTSRRSLTSGRAASSAGRRATPTGTTGCPRR